MDAVIIPETLIFEGNLELFSVPLLIFDALSPCKLVPKPLKLFAVIMPVRLISEGNLEFVNVPLVILVALIPCKSVPNPLKLYAVIIPDALILPVELNPTPELVLGLFPT